MNVRPLQDRLLVRRVEEEEKTRGGLFIPDAAKERPRGPSVTLTALARTSTPRPTAARARSSKMMSLALMF